MLLTLHYKEKVMNLATFVNHFPAATLSLVLFLLCFSVAYFWIPNVDKFKPVILASPFPVLQTLALLALLASLMLFSTAALLIILPFIVWQLVIGEGIVFTNLIGFIIQVLSTCTLLCFLNFFLFFLSMSIWKWMTEEK
jgi:hypothetical protein